MQAVTKAGLASAALLLAAMVLAGCDQKHATQPSANTTATNSSTPTATAARHAPVDPCSVLTGDEVSAVTGLKVTKTEVIDRDCHYDDAFNEDGTVLSIYPTDGKEQMQAITDSNKLLGGIGSAASHQSDVGKDVQASITPPAAGGAPSIGDEAVWQPNDALAVRKGDTFVGVRPPIARDPAGHHGVMFSDADKRVISQKLAEAALAKLVH